MSCGIRTRGSWLVLFTVLLVGGSPAAAPQDRSIENLQAFARLYGYVRWFHPSDAAAGIDWTRFAIHGVRQIQLANTRAELRSTLAALFEPIAPTLRVYYPDERPVLPLLVPADTTGLRVVAWQHRGVGLSPGATSTSSAPSP